MAYKNTKNYDNNSVHKFTNYEKMQTLYIAPDVVWQTTMKC